MPRPAKRMAALSRKKRATADIGALRPYRPAPARGSEQKVAAHSLRHAAAAACAAF